MEKIEKLDKKTFCPNGRVNPKNHFYVDPSKWNEENLVPEIKIGNYPILTEPQEFWELLIKEFTQQIQNLTQNKLPNLLPKPISLDTLFNKQDNYKETYYQGKNCILLLDEIDSLSFLDKETRQRFLSILRGIKQENLANEGAYSLFSVLGITNWVGEYLEDTIGGSPFNISNKITSSYFTKEEVYELFGQYEKQEGIQMDSQIKDDIFEETEGSQGLTVLFGRIFARLRDSSQKIQSFSEWKNFTYGNQIFSYVQDESVNVSKMTRLINEGERSERCKSVLLLFLSRQIIEKDYIREINLLQRANILKREEGQLKIASKFIKRLLLYFISNERNIILQHLPLDEKNMINIPFLVEKVVESLNVFEFITGEKLKENKCAPQVYPGCSEVVYVEEFHRCLKMCLSNFKSVIYGREKSISTDLLKGFDIKRIESLPQKAISCDTVLDFGEFGIYAIEHGANLSLEKKNSKKTRSTLWHHVYNQAELYHYGLKAKQTWVINWTTIDYGKGTNQITYWFPSSNTVNVIYIYHSQDFSLFKIYFPENLKPKIINKSDALNFEKFITSSQEKKENFKVNLFDLPLEEKKLLYVKIGVDGKVKDLPGLEEQTFDELKKFIKMEYPQNGSIQKERFEIFTMVDYEERPVSKDVSVEKLKDGSTLLIKLNDE